MDMHTSAEQCGSGCMPMPAHMLNHPCRRMPYCWTRTAAWATAGQRSAKFLGTGETAVGACSCPCRFTRPLAANQQDAKGPLVSLAGRTMRSRTAGTHWLASTQAWSEPTTRMVRCCFALLFGFFSGWAACAWAACTRALTLAWAGMMAWPLCAAQIGKCATCAVGQRPTHLPSRATACVLQLHPANPHSCTRPALPAAAVQTSRGASGGARGARQQTKMRTVSCTLRSISRATRCRQVAL